MKIELIAVQTKDTLYILNFKVKHKLMFNFDKVKVTNKGD